MRDIAGPARRDVMDIAGPVLRGGRDSVSDGTGISAIFVFLGDGSTLVLASSSFSSISIALRTAAA